MSVDKLIYSRIFSFAASARRACDLASPSRVMPTKRVSRSPKLVPAGSRSPRAGASFAPPSSDAAPRAAATIAAAAIAPAPNASAEPSSPRWTFLTNHAHVLILLSQNSSLVLREVAARIGITERAVQRIVADLEDDGFIERAKVGRQNQYRLRTEQALRHPIESHRTIGDLIQLVTGDDQDAG